MLDKQIHRVGKRKTSIARLFLRPRAGEVGAIRVNDRSIEDYFPRMSLQKIIAQPLVLTSTLGQFDFLVNVRGGGLASQASAIRHAISRALNEYDVALRPILKKAGFLTRDSREVERKKYGLSGARKRFQFSKR